MIMGVHGTGTTGVDGYRKAMYENFTDAENTGVPLVPMVEEPSSVATDGGQSQQAEYEEVILSHRLGE